MPTATCLTFPNMAWNARSATRITLVLAALGLTVTGCGAPEPIRRARPVVVADSGGAPATTAARTALAGGALSGTVLSGTALSGGAGSATSSTRPANAQAPANAQDPADAHDPENARDRLVAEAIAAHDAAYADLLAAEAVPDEYLPRLVDHLEPGQLEQWRSVIRRLREKGLRVRANNRLPSWRRVEHSEVISTHEVRLNTCRLDTEEAVDGGGNVVSTTETPHRYLETMVRSDTGWRWEGREWIDPPDRTDCAA